MKEIKKKLQNKSVEDLKELYAIYIEIINQIREIGDVTFSSFAILNAIRKTKPHFPHTEFQFLLDVICEVLGTTEALKSISWYKIYYVPGNPINPIDQYDFISKLVDIQNNEDSE